MRNNCHTCPAPLSKWDTSGQCETCRAAVWRERSNPTRVPASHEVIAQEVRDWWDRTLAAAQVEAHVTDTLTRTAYHESGHVVTALALGLRVDSVSLDLGPGRLGEGDTRASGWSGGPTQVAEVALGGAIAERRFLGEISDGCGHDEAMVTAAMETGSMPSASSVRSIVELNAPAVKLIAEALLEHGELSGGDVDAVLSGAPLFRPGTAPLAARSAPMMENRATVYQSEPPEVPGKRIAHIEGVGYRYVGEEHYRSCVRDFAGEMVLR